jgi:hypothetical protein
MAGTVMDQSCSPVTFEHVKEMSEAYAKVGTVEAITRRRHGKLFVEVPQAKVCHPYLRANSGV